MEFNFLHTDNGNAVLACVSPYFFLHYAFDDVHYHSVVTVDVDTVEDSDRAWVIDQDIILLLGLPSRSLVLLSGVQSVHNLMLP